MDCCQPEIFMSFWFIFKHGVIPIYHVLRGNFVLHKLVSVDGRKLGKPHFTSNVSCRQTPKEEKKKGMNHYFRCAIPVDLTVEHLTSEPETYSVVEVTAQTFITAIPQKCLQKLLVFHFFVTHQLDRPMLTWALIEVFNFWGAVKNFGGSRRRPGADFSRRCKLKYV